MSKNIELSLAIPFYNEENNVMAVLSNLASCLDDAKLDYQIVAIDNGSRDKTGKIIDEFTKKNNKIKKLEIKINKGYGFGVNKGLQACEGKYIGYLWGDNQISPSAAIRVFKKLKAEGLDLCKVRRVRRTESLFRKLQSKAYNSLMDVLFGIKSSDLNGCPKIMNSKIYKELNIQSKDWFIDAEIMLKCKVRGYSVGEIPVIPKERKEGKSNVNFMASIEFIKNILKYKMGISNG